MKGLFNNLFLLMTEVRIDWRGKKAYGMLHTLWEWNSIGIVIYEVK